MSDEQDPPSVAVENVSHGYGSGHGYVTALDGVSFEVKAGETLAVIGESGSGKSTLVRLIAGLELPARGAVYVDGAPPVVRAGPPSTVQIVFQDPGGSLNPYLCVGRSVSEPLRKVRGERRRAQVGEMLDRVGIDPARFDDRPGRFSGGQLQRLALARALMARPTILLCDEPTSALDVSVQAQILNLLQELQEEIGFSCVFVTHDLAVAEVVADRVLVLKSGQVREIGDAKRFFAGATDPYSRELVLAAAGGALALPAPALGERSPGGDERVFKK